MATNVYFNGAVKSEQNMYEDLIIESISMYGQDVFYIPRVSISDDQILNEEYFREWQCRLCIERHQLHVIRLRHAGWAC